jgi:hypothetical protein
MAARENRDQRHTDDLVLPANDGAQGSFELGGLGARG